MAPARRSPSRAWRVAAPAAGGRQPVASQHYQSALGHDPRHQRHHDRRTGSSPQRPVPAGPATALTNGPRDRPMVALTFHLGPHLADEDVALAHQLLDDAGRLGAPITVFAVGRWLDQHRDLVPSILAGGNELDNHTYTHPVLTDLTAGAVASEITLCRDVLTRLAPSQGRYFRPSGTSQATPLILEQAGVAGYSTVVDFDVDPLDYTDPGADAVVATGAGRRPTRFDREHALRSSRHGRGVPPHHRRLAGARAGASTGPNPARLTPGNGPPIQPSDASG